MKGFPSKQAIAQSFSKAAISYDSFAEIQQCIGGRLLKLLPSSLSNVNCVMDLGCGTGYFTKELQQVFGTAYLIGLDLAEGMVSTAKASVVNVQWLVADAEQLPLLSNSVDTIFSNLAVQWCHDFYSVLAEAKRVLKPGGVFLFTSLCKGTLCELADSWQTVDQHVHVNNFLSFDEYQEVIKCSGFRVQEVQQRSECFFYSKLIQLMQGLKGIGAHNINPGRKKTLMGRKQWQLLNQAYELFRTKKGLPATYQVIYGVLIKE